MTDDELLAELYKDVTLYDALKSAGVPLDNHYSDLYVEVNDTSRAILRHYGAPQISFRSNLDGKVWFDVPFAFDPYWVEKTGNHSCTSFQSGT